MKCPNCGSEIGTNKVCDYCGTQISYEMQKEQEQLKKAGCPKCGSTNIQFKRENQGEVRGKHSKQVIHRTVGFCKDCGATWYTSGSDDLPKKGKTWLWVLGWIFIFPLPLTILLLRKKDLKPAIKYGIIIAAWIVYIIIAATGGSGSDKTINTPTDTNTQQEVDITVDEQEENNEATTSEDNSNAEGTIPFVEDETLLNFTKYINDNQDLDSDGLKAYAESIGLNFTLDELGWGGSTHTWIAQGLNNSNDNVTVYYVNPQKDDYIDTLREYSITYYAIYKKTSLSLEYYTEWNRDNYSDGKYGYYVGDKMFDSFSEAYSYYISLAE